MSSDKKQQPRTGNGETGSSWKGKPKARDCAQVTKDNVLMIRQPSKEWALARLLKRARQRP